MAKLKASQHAAVFSQLVSYTCSTISLCYPTAKLDSGCCYRDQILIQQYLLYNRQILNKQMSLLWWWRFDITMFAFVIQPQNWTQAAAVVIKFWYDDACLCFTTTRLNLCCFGMISRWARMWWLEAAWSRWRKCLLYILHPRVFGLLQ